MHKCTNDNITIYLTKKKKKTMRVIVDQDMLASSGNVYMSILYLNEIMHVYVKNGVCPHNNTNAVKQ